MYEICFIDDTIPVTSLDSINESKRLNRSNLQLIISAVESWPEEEVRSLVNELLVDESSWSVSAFIHPNIYLNSVVNESYRPDIIIYDWEYAGGTDDSSTLLLEVLRSTFSVVYIYSGADHKTQIDQALQQTELNSFYNKRLFLLMKDEENSHQKLLGEAKNFFERNFSFRFGSSLRKATISALDQVLINLGSHDIDFVKLLLADHETEETDVKRFIVEKVRHHLFEARDLYEMLRTIDEIDEQSIRELLGIFITKLTTKINSIQIDMNLPPRTSKSDEEENEISKPLWSQRLYYQPSDSLVRKGDIIQDKESRFYLVITADCDLNRFWSKNYGYINIVPMYESSRDVQYIKTKISLTKTESQFKNALKNSRIKSLTGNVSGMSEGIFVCPFFKIDDDMHTLIGFPKEIKSIEVMAPGENNLPGELKNKCLTYDYMDGYIRIISISEPFVTALVQHCIFSISGYGTPDYPNAIQKILPEELQKALFINTNDSEG